ncbi:sugar phosphate isomerase/epimerase [bacterium]|nr:sugar phosphate isomerase/epimerase [bacterium]MBU1634102.1 sugar phosphate isomerase/epimerase [bacterium]
MNENISLSTAAFFPRDIAEIISLANSVGVKTLELMPQDISECTPEFALEIKRIDPNMWIYSVHFPLVLLQFFFNPHPRARKTGEQISRNLIAMAADLDTRIIVMHSPRKEKGTPVFRDISIEHIRYLCDLAAEKDIKIAIENNPGSETSQPDDLMAFIKELDRDNLNIVVDTTESMEAGVNPEDFLRNIPRVDHLHVSDFSDQGKHLPLGRGVIDWATIVKLMKQKKYPGKWVIELSYRHLLKNAQATLQESVNILSQLLNNA